jgi:cobalt-zinc-cadmium efflux system membrane fusion protein
MEIASPTEQDFEVTIKAAGKRCSARKQSKVTTFVGGKINHTFSR